MTLIVGSRPTPTCFSCPPASSAAVLPANRKLYRSANILLGGSQRSFCGLLIDSGFEHDQSDRGTAGICQRPLCNLSRDPGKMLNYADAALSKLGVFWTDIDHQVAVNVSQSGECPRREHIQNHLLRA